MVYNSLKQIQVFYEMAMSIGNSLDLMEMLKSSISSYLQKLGCSAGIVIRLAKRNDGTYEPLNEFSIPYTIEINKLYDKAIGMLPEKYTAPQLIEFQSWLPIKTNIEENKYMYIFNLPDFGLLVLIKHGDAFSDELLLALEELNNKLAKASIACIHKQALEASEATNRAIISSLPDMLFHFNKDELLLNYNFVKSDVSVFEDVRIDKHISRLFPKHLAHQLKIAIQSCLEQGSYIFEFKSSFEYKTIQFEARVSKINSREVIILLRDVTENREYEANLKKAFEKAELANKSKSEFLANMSHEIRTPMNAILGFTEALFHKIKDEAQQKMLKTILSSGNVLLSLINDILDMSKIEAGKLEINLQPIYLPNIISEICQIFSEKAQNKGIVLETVISDAFPGLLWLDEIRVRQILLNLLGNAVKFTDEGYIHIGLDFEKHTETVGKLTLRVADSGIGIPESQQDIIFEAFRQQSGQNNRKYAGTGLGLAITKKLVEKMNGHILLQSAPGKGSCFQVIIDNIRFQSSHRQPLEELGDENSKEIIFGKSTMLIVDDIKTNMKVIKHLVESSDITIIEADNGEIALEILNHHKPDMILMDIRMPGMDGYKVTRIIRNQPATRDIPVIAFTASILEQKNITENKLFNGLLIKPVTKKKLEEELKKYLPYQVISEPRLEKNTTMQDLLADQIKMLPEIVNILETQLLPTWENVKNKLLLFKIEEFADMLARQTAVYGIPQINTYVSRLRLAIEAFDLESIETTLKGFPDLIQSLKQMVK